MISLLTRNRLYCTVSHEVGFGFDFSNLPPAPLPRPPDLSGTVDSSARPRPAFGYSPSPASSGQPRDPELPVHVRLQQWDIAGVRL